MLGVLQCVGADDPDARSKRCKFSTMTECERAVNAKQRMFSYALLYVILGSWNTAIVTFSEGQIDLGVDMGCLCD